MKLKFVGVFIMLAMSACTFASSFKIVALPDTQLYSQDYPETFVAQTQWVVNNAATENIAFLTHLGDIVNTGDDSVQWTNANTAMDILKGVLPYSACLGNHDQTVNGEKNDGCFYFDTYFGPRVFKNYDWFGGSNRRGTSSYQIFQAGGRTWLHLNMEYMPDVESLLWAQRVLDTHSDLPTIYSTHAYITDKASNELLEDPNEAVAATAWCSPSTDTVANIGGFGQWARLVANNDQIFMVLSGHSSGTDCESMIVLDNIFGHEVYQLCQDYQSRDNGGDGWLRIFEFDDAANQINVKTYSPTLNQYETDENSQFNIAMDFSRFDNIEKREEVPTVQAANIQVIQYGTGNEAEDVNVFIPGEQHTAMFGLCDPNDDNTPYSNRGDIQPQIGSFYSDDAENGIYFASIAENGRMNEHYYTQTVTHYHTPLIGHGESCNWLGVLTVGQMFGETYYSGGHEDNVNIGAAYFPFSGGWTGGYACNLDNNGVTYVLKSSENLTLDKELVSGTGTMQIGPYAYTYSGAADWELTIPGVDSRYDGVLLTCGGKNEDNYAVSGAALDGSGWVICVRDNGQLYEESDPFNFVYIPFETPGIAAGVLSPKCGVYNGTVNSDGVLNFQIEHITTGTLRLTIDDQTPETGTLLIGGNVSRYSTDNFVNYEPDGDGWIIRIYDLNNAGATSLQDMADEGVQFAFIPFENAPAAPGPNRGFDSADISAADFTVTCSCATSVNQIYGSVLPKNMRNYLTIGSCDSGDYNVIRNGARISGAEGVLFGTIREKLRQEPTDTASYRTVISARADGWLAIGKTAGNEYNANFATAFIPYEAGFTCGNVHVTGSNGDNGVSETVSYGPALTVVEDYDDYVGRYQVSLEGVTPEDGVLFASAEYNGAIMATIAPTGDNGSWDIAISKASVAAGYYAYPFSYMYVPYTSRDMMIGRVSADGDVVNGNAVFTVTNEETGTYRISMKDGSPAEGMLILNSYGTDDLGPAHVILCYEDDGGDFIVYTAKIAGSTKAAVAINSDFVFGYIPFDKTAQFTDCNTNLVDFSEFASMWLSTVDSPVFDYDNSSEIDYTDLDQFADCWLR